MHTKLTRITPREAGKMLDMTTDAVQSALIQGVFPFGFALINQECEYRKYTYYIFKELLIMFINGKLSCLCNKCMEERLQGTKY